VSYFLLPLSTPSTSLLVPHSLFSIPICVLPVSEFVTYGAPNFLAGTTIPSHHLSNKLYIACLTCPTLALFLIVQQVWRSWLECTRAHEYIQRHNTKVMSYTNIFPTPQHPYLPLVSIYVRELHLKMWYVVVRLSVRSVTLHARKKHRLFSPSVRGCDYGCWSSTGWLSARRHSSLLGGRRARRPRSLLPGSTSSARPFAGCAFRL